MINKKMCAAENCFKEFFTENTRQIYCNNKCRYKETARLVREEDKKATKHARAVRDRRKSDYQEYSDWCDYSGHFF